MISYILLSSPRNYRNQSAAAGKGKKCETRKQEKYPHPKTEKISHVGTIALYIKNLKTPTNHPWRYPLTLKLPAQISSHFNSASPCSGIFFIHHLNFARERPLGRLYKSDLRLYNEQILTLHLHFVTASRPA